jgi:hypothetical protein
MPSPRRADEAGAIYHALNRGNARLPIFHKDEDFVALGIAVALAPSDRTRSKASVTLAHPPFAQLG